MEANEFKVGVKFKYMGDNYPTQRDIIQTITNIYDTTVYTDILNVYETFDVKSRYAKECVFVEDIFTDLIKNIFNLFYLKSNKSLTNDEINEKIKKELNTSFLIGFKNGELEMKRDLKRQINILFE